MSSNRLSEYLTENGTSQRAFADKIGVSPSYLNELVKNLKQPRLDLAFEIERVTHGAVPARSWVKPPAHKSPSGAAA
ncbi:MAG: helix-turn-helix transcriptional regulator [Limimaricola soesokkakensis]|uniref:helix-turn-helix transcriptional regulator n=1 Tax=Limimaricola soesokkakensis TaxID=1343159 RepID=UPI004057F732